LAILAGLSLATSSFALKHESGNHVRFATNPQGVIFVTVRTEGHDAVFILDTGATVTYVDIAALKLDARPQFFVPVEQTNQRTSRGVYQLQLQMGEEKISGQFIEIDLTGTRRECSCEVVGLLGMDLLSHYVSVEIDFREGIIRFRR